MSTSGGSGGGGAWTSLGSVTLSAAAASIGFTGISQAYSDLHFVMSGPAPSGSSTDVYLILNADTAAHYYYAGFNANSGGVGYYGGGPLAPASTVIAQTPGSGYFSYTCDILDYLSTANAQGAINWTTDFYLTLTQRYGYAGSWSGLGPVTEVQFENTGGDWAVGTKLRMYGIV